MIAIGSDHGGIELKEQMIEHLKKRGIECKDVGCYSKESKNTVRRPFCEVSDGVSIFLSLLQR